MESRRQFLKQAAASAVLLGPARAADGLTLATQVAQGTQSAKPTVVLARDPALESGHLDEKRVLELLDRAMAAYTGRDLPVEAWKRVVPPGAVIGLKINGLGGRGISTHSVLVQAVAERLQQAGVPAGNLVVWDRNARDLEACGMTINTNAGKLRCFGSDVSGYESREESCGPARIRFSNILARECGFVISMPILKDHTLSGMTFSMKNMYGVIDRPFLLHANYCNPGVADLNALPLVRNKVRFTIGDALTCVYQGGPEFRPQYLWRSGSLIIGQDRVAVDSVALRMLERKRASAGLPSLAADGRAPAYIAVAADSNHRLGVDDLNRIRLVEI